MRKKPKKKKIGKLHCIFYPTVKYYQSLLYSCRKTPYPPHGRSSEIPRGRGVLKANILEAKYEAKLKFLRRRGGAKQKTFHGGSMDISVSTHSDL